MDQAFFLRFPELSQAQANIEAQTLADHLSREIDSNGFRVERIRENKEAQDFGTTLVLVLGTAAVTEVAKGIKAWLAGHTGASLEISTADGKLVVRNASSASLAKIAEAFAGHTQKP